VTNKITDLKQLRNNIVKPDNRDPHVAIIYGQHKKQTDSGIQSLADWNLTDTFINQITLCLGKFNSVKTLTLACKM